MEREEYECTGHRVVAGLWMGATTGALDLFRLTRKFKVPFKPEEGKEVMWPLPTDDGPDGKMFVGGFKSVAYNVQEGRYVVDFGDETRIAIDFADSPARREYANELNGRLALLQNVGFKVADYKTASPFVAASRDAKTDRVTVVAFAPTVRERE